MKKLFFIVRHFTPNSGSYAGMVEEVSKYASKKYDVSILCAQLDLPRREKLPYANIVRFPVSGFQIPSIGMNNQYLSLAKSVKKYVKKHNPDYIIANGRAALGVIDRKYVLRMSQPAKVFLQNMEIAPASIKTKMARRIHYTFQHYLEKKVVRNAAAIISSSKTSYDLVRDTYNIPQKPHFIPHSGVKSKELQHGKDLGFPGKNILFISAGKEKVRKGVIFLEEALPSLFEKHPDLHLVHVGDRFHWDIPQYQDRIKSVGRVPWGEMKNYYASADMLLVASLVEWIPNVIFEALAAGLPVVTSDLEGVDEVINHEKDGYIFSRGDVSGLREGIEYMLKKKVDRDILRDKVKDMEYEKFSKELLAFMEHKKTKNLL